MQLYLYRTNRSRAWSLDETGTFYGIEAGPQKEGHYNDHYHDEDVDLLCILHALDYEAYEKRIRLTEDGEWYSGSDVLHNSFTVLEAACFLNLSEQRIRALIANKQLSARKRGAAWFISGEVLVTFAVQERPAHRPNKKPIMQSGELTPYSEAAEPLAHRLTLRLAQYWSDPQQLLSNDGMVQWTIQELLNQIGIQPSRQNPKQTKGRLERALDLLRRDNIIGSYSMRVQGDSIAIQEAEQRLAHYAPGWWSLYAAQTVSILPP